MDCPMSAGPPTSLSAISHVQSVVVHNANFNLEQKNVNRSQPLVDDARQILDWLTPIDFSSVQNDTLSKHTIGTGTWFFEHKNFQEWFSSEIPSVLWVKGMLGAGKTVLSSIIINHLERSFSSGQGDTAITFAYCRHSDRYSMTDILASFVKQLAQRHSDVLSLAKSAYMNHCEDGTPPHHEELSDILRKSIPLFNRVYMIIDAVDEFPDDARDNFLKALVSFPARLLVTSRPSITPYLLEGKPYIDMGNQNQNDIELFIDQNAEESSSLRRLLRGNEELWSQIRTRLKETSRDMFLIASLQVESLKSCTTANELRNATETFSSNIKDTYLSTWARIEAQPKTHFSLATRAIIWLAYARRPLKISELQHALAVRRDVDTFDDDDVTSEETIISVCRGLIVVERESQIVRFVHFTVLDFFNGLGRRVHPSPHTLITESCLSYLQASQFTGRKMATQRELEAFLNSKERPLHDYAYHHWGDHALGCYEEVGLRMPHALLDFLEECHQYPCMVNGTDFDLFERPHIIAYYGLQDISSRAHADRGRLTSIKGFTPLILACAQGNVDNVRVLLSQTASVNTHAKNGHTALYAASNNGHTAVVRLLLSHRKIAVNTQTKYGWTALSGASSKGHEAIVKLLLSHPDIAVNTQTKDGRTALSAASSSGHVGVVEQLLCRPDIVINTQTKDGWTGLSAASNNGHGAVVKLLLSHPHIAVNTQMKDGRTALSAASDNGHKSIVKLLLSHPHITVNIQTNDGWTALYTASKNGYTAVVQLLLSHRDVILNTPTKEGQTALDAAVHRGHAEVIRLLTDSLRSGFLQKDLYIRETAVT